MARISGSRCRWAHGVLLRSLSVAISVVSATFKAAGHDSGFGVGEGGNLAEVDHDRSMLITDGVERGSGLRKKSGGVRRRHVEDEDVRVSSQVASKGTIVGAESARIAISGSVRACIAARLTRPSQR